MGLVAFQYGEVSSKTDLCLAHAILIKPALDLLLYTQLCSLCIVPFKSRDKRN